MPIGEQKLTLDPKDKDQTLNYAVRSERLRELVASRKAAGLSARDPRFVADLLREVEGMAIESVDESMFIHEAVIDLSENDLQLSSVSNDVIVAGDEVFFKVKKYGTPQFEHLLNIEGIHLNNVPCISGSIEFCGYVNKTPFFRMKHRDMSDHSVIEFVNSQGKSINQGVFASSDQLTEVVDENMELKAFMRVRNAGGLHDMKEILDLNGNKISPEGIVPYSRVAYVRGELAYELKLPNKSRKRIIWGKNEIQSQHEKDDFSLPFDFNGQICVIQSMFDPRNEHYVLCVKDIVTGQTTGSEILPGTNEDDDISIENVLICGNAVYCVLNSDNLGETDCVVCKIGNGKMEIITGGGVLQKIALTGSKLVTVREQHIDEDDMIIIELEDGETASLNQDKDILNGKDGIFVTDQPIEIFGQTGTLFYMTEETNVEGDSVNYLYVDNNKIEMIDCEVRAFRVVRNHLFWDNLDNDGNRTLWIDGKKTNLPCQFGSWKVVYSRGKYFLINNQDKKISIREIKNLI